MSPHHINGIFLRISFHANLSFHTACRLSSTYASPTSACALFHNSPRGFRAVLWLFFQGVEPRPRTCRWSGLISHGNNWTDGSIPAQSCGVILKVCTIVLFMRFSIISLCYPTANKEVVVYPVHSQHWYILAL